MRRSGGGGGGREGGGGGGVTGPSWWCFMDAVKGEQSATPWGKRGEERGRGGRGR